MNTQELIKALVSPEEQQAIRVNRARQLAQSLYELSLIETFSEQEEFEKSNKQALLVKQITPLLDIVSDADDDADTV